MCIIQIISKVIHIEKLKLEVIDKILDIGNCIRFDVINATLLFQSLFCTFLVLFYTFSALFATLSCNFELIWSDFPLFFPQNLNFAKIWTKIIKHNWWKQKIRVFKLSISNLDLLKLSVFWRNYQCRYCYQNCREKYQKSIVIKQMTYHWSLLLGQTKSL